VGDIDFKRYFPPYGRGELGVVFVFLKKKVGLGARGGEGPQMAGGVGGLVGGGGGEGGRGGGREGGDGGGGREGTEVHVEGGRRRGKQ